MKKFFVLHYEITKQSMDLEYLYKMNHEQFRTTVWQNDLD